MIYAPNDTAIPFDLSDPNALVQLNSNFMGFFLSTDILPSLQNPLCVGVRIYHVVDGTNAGHPTQLLAVGALADGSDDIQTYKQANGTSPAHSLDRTNALTIANPYHNDSYMSFFSRDVITELVQNGLVDGFSIFASTLAHVNDSDFQNNQSNDLVTRKAQVMTHVIAPMNLVNGMIPFLSSTDITRTSIHPCPGHCVKMNDINFDPEISTPTSTNDPYLFDW